MSCWTKACALCALLAASFTGTTSASVLQQTRHKSMLPKWKKKLLLEPSTFPPLLLSTKLFSLFPSLPSILSILPLHLHPRATMARSVWLSYDCWRSYLGPKIRSWRHRTGLCGSAFWDGQLRVCLMLHPFTKYSLIVNISWVSVITNV